MTLHQGHYLRTGACGILVQEGMYCFLFETSTKLPHQLAWDMNLGTDIDMEDWSRWSTMVHKGISNTTLVEANDKILARWYIIPTKLAMIFPDASPLCFRSGRHVGTMCYTWWTCPKIKCFWTITHHPDLYCDLC